MQILEHGQEHERTLLFFPCTAEPVWAFADTIAQLSQRWHVFQVVYDGHQPEYPGDFTSVEQTVDEVISYLKSRSVSRLDGAYGCSMGGACLTRMLALGKIPISRAIIDGGITPYQLPFLVRKLLLARDVLSFKMAANSRKILEAAFPPERFTPCRARPQKRVRCHGSLSQNLFRSDDPQYILVRQQLRASEVPRKNRHEAHLLVRR